MIIGIPSACSIEGDTIDDGLTEIGLEFDALTAASYWRYFFLYPDGTKITGEWRKKRNKAKKDLQLALLAPKTSKKDPDKVLLAGQWRWGSDRFFDRSSSSQSQSSTKG